MSIRFKRKDHDQLRLRHTFVAMLFSLTAGQIAVFSLQIASILKSVGWQEQLLAPCAHLALALVIVSASWVEWSKGATSPTARPLDGIFQWPFVILLLDVFLVILYFIFVSWVEIDLDLIQIFRQFSPNHDLPFVVPSATEESIMLMVIFATYAFWDLLHDVIMEIGDNTTSVIESLLTAIRKPIKVVLNFLVYGSASIVSIALVWFVYKNTKGVTETVLVLSADIALLGTVIGFRAMKMCESQLAILLLSRRRDWNLPVPRSDTGYGRWILFIALYVVGIGFLI